MSGTTASTTSYGNPRRRSSGLGCAVLSCLGFLFAPRGCAVSIRVFAAEYLLCSGGGTRRLFRLPAHLHEEAARHLGPLDTPLRPTLAERKRELVFGARNADVAKASFLV